MKDLVVLRFTAVPQGFSDGGVNDEKENERGPPAIDMVNPYNTLVYTKL